MALESLINKYDIIEYTYEDSNKRKNVFRVNDKEAISCLYDYSSELIKNGYILIEPDNNPAHLNKMYYKNIDLNKIVIHIKLEDYYLNNMRMETINYISFTFTVVFMNKDDQKLCGYMIPTDLRYPLTASLKKWHYFNLLKYILTNYQLKSLYERLRFLSNVIICKKIERKLLMHLLPSKYDYILSFDVKEK